MLINELFTSAQTQLGNPAQAYPLEYLQMNNSRMTAQAQAGTQWLEVDLVRVSHREDPRVLEISFEVDGSQDRTGGGDAVAIFNTVLVAINHFLQHNLAPDFFIFAAEGSSRVSLYKRMLSRFLARVGYTSAGYDDLPISVQDNWWQGGSGADVFIAKRIQKESQQLDEVSFTDYRINDYLEARGYKLIGSGLDQLTYLTPNQQMVLKIFGSTEKKSRRKNIPFTADQMMFFKWADYCVQNSTNPFLPKFIEGEGGKPWAPFDLENRRYLQIWQERLYEIDNETGQDLGRLASIAYSSQAMGEPDAGKYLRQWAKTFTKWEKSSLRRLTKRFGTKQVVLLFKTLRELAAHAQAQNWSLDLHEGNFLQRKNGFPVIADPWAIVTSRSK